MDKYNMVFGPRARTGARLSDLAVNFTRRTFLGMAAASSGVLAAQGIDRRALVRRHNPVLTAFDPRSPLSVGNGELAFTADATGLQTFPALYERDVPLCTQSQWGWHSFPAPKSLALRLTPYDTRGRQVGYATSSEGQEEMYNWLRQNPHRLHLGRIGLRLITREGAAARPDDLTGIRQELDLWTGILHSRFRFGSEDVSVETACHPALDALAVGIRSPLLESGRLAVAFEFPYGSPQMNAADWTRDDAHRSVLAVQARSAGIRRELDADRYFVKITWDQRATLDQAGSHRFLLRPAQSELHFTCAFAAKEPPPRAGNVLEASSHHWPRFWTQGAAIDLSGAPGPQARELERRIVLSQYLTASNALGPCRRKKPALPVTPGTASSIWRCTGGMPHISPYGAGSTSWSAASIGTLPSCRRRVARQPSKATAARAGRRWLDQKAATAHRRSARC